MDYDQIIYFVGVWVIGTTAGCFRSARDGDYNGIGHLFSIGAVAGFLSFGVVTIGGFYTGGQLAIGCGVAALVGSFGREVTDLIIVDVSGAVSGWVKKLFGRTGDGEQ
jgi:hypothetical protein